MTHVRPSSLRRPAARWGALAAVAALALTACGGDSDDADSSAASTTSSSSPAGEGAGNEPAGGGTPSSEVPPPDVPVAGTDDPEPEYAGGDVDVVTTYFGYDPGLSAVVIGGYAAGVVEEGGTCTATLVQGDRTAAGTSEGVADARTTACPEIRIPGSSLGSGAWSATLSYESPRAAGTAEPVTVEVP